MLDPEDVRALDARIEGAVRAGVVSVLHAVASLYAASLPPLTGARLLRQLAHEFGEGSAPMTGEVGLRLVVEEYEEVVLDDGAGEREPDERFPIERVREGSNGMLLPANTDGFSVGMVEWLDEFDDRIRMLPGFAPAVNEAAENGFLLTDRETVRIVADRARELTAEAEARAADEEVTPPPQPRGGMRARTED